MAGFTLDRLYTPAEYLEIELAEPRQRYEYVDGRIYAMAGGSINHGILISNSLYRIREALSQNKQDCAVFSGDVKVQIDSAQAYLYPDVFVVCGEIEKEEAAQAIRNPILIIEVLSKSTQRYDQSSKFRLYRSLPSVQAYWMIHQDQVLVETFTRMEQDTWKIRSFHTLDEALISPSLGLSVKLTELYERVSI